MNLKLTQKLRIEKQRLLLVEGKDEILFFNSYLKYLKIDNIQVIEVKGKEQFKSQIPKLKIRPEFSNVIKLGLVRDADNDFNGALQSIYDRLKENNFAPIKEHNNFSHTMPGIGIFIMPKFESVGSLEDLCLEAVDVENRLNCTNNYINCIKTENEEINKISKRKIQVYLASQKDLCQSLGLGAQKKYWNFESSSYNDIENFLKTLSN